MIQPLFREPTNHSLLCHSSHSGLYRLSTMGCIVSPLWREWYRMIQPPLFSKIWWYSSMNITLQYVLVVQFNLQGVIYTYMYWGLETHHEDVSAVEKIQSRCGYSVLQCVAVCCSVVHCVAVFWSFLQCMMQCVAVWCRALRVLQCVAVCCSGLQWVAVGCSGLQWVAVCCSVLWWLMTCTHVICAKWKTTYVHTRLVQNGVLHEY